MKLKDKRKREIKLRKNFLPALVITLFLWTTIAFIVYFVDPFSYGATLLFFLTIFSALLFTFSLFFANTRRGLITALGLTTFLILRYLGIGNIVNFLLLLGLGIAIEMYFLRN